MLLNGTELQQTLEIIIDGVAHSDATQQKRQMGIKLLNLVIANYQGEVSEQTRQAIQSIIEMAAETDSPVFKC